MLYTHATPCRPEDMETLAAVIRAEAPDVVTLQEVVLRRGQHRTLAELAGGYTAAAEGDANDRHSQAVLLRDGLEASPAPPVRGFRGAAIRLRMPEGPALIAVSTHSQAGRFSAERAGQHKALAAWAAEAGASAPVVVGGDLNFDSEPGSFTHRLERLRRRLPFLPDLASANWDEDCAGMAALFGALTDLAGGSGTTAGAPRHWPKILLPWGLPLIPLAWCLGVGGMRARLDYVLGSKRLSKLEARVLRVTGAGAAGHPAVPRGSFPWMDHDPVVVRFAAN